MLKKILVPNFMVTSVADIDLARLRKLGVRGILLDFDNTLVRWNGSSLPNAIAKWVKAAKEAGFSLCIVSNAITRRLERVAKRLGIPFVPQACKPSPIGIYRALKRLCLQAYEAVMVGDQLFTDVLAGNCSGLHTDLGRPPKLYVQWWMKGVRYLENLITKYTPRLQAAC